MNCLIYVHSAATGEELMDVLSRLLGVHDRGPVPWAIETSDFYISVRNNEFADESAAHRFPDGFLNFPLYVEVSSDDDTEAGQTEAAELIGKILQAFWDGGVPAVAECNFDELLPLEGGYRRSEVPWPASPSNSR